MITKSAIETASPPERPIFRKNVWQARFAESCLEDAFLPDHATLVSFLINALYLFGEHGINAYGGAPEPVAAELTRLGHRLAWGDRGAGRAEGSLGRAARHDRALMLARAFGGIEAGADGSDAEFVERLRAVRRELRPGGLICFHVFDRDRVWSLTGDRTLEKDGRRARVRVAFDPESGRLSARLANPFAGTAAVKAWNLAEIRTLLRAAGLELERAYGDWDGRSPEAAGAETGRLIIVAAKPRIPARPGSRARYAPRLRA